MNEALEDLIIFAKRVYDYPTSPDPRERLSLAGNHVAQVVALLDENYVIRVERKGRLNWAVTEVFQAALANCGEDDYQYILTAANIYSEIINNGYEVVVRYA
jgi:hypothetical protein